MNESLPVAGRFTLAQMRRILATVLIAAGILGYGNSFQGEFVLDDISCLRDNPSLGELFPDPSEVPPGFHHRPVGRWSFTLNERYSGKTAEGTPRVEGFHITNAVIHVLAALVLFGLVQSTLRRPRFARWTETDGLWFAFAVALIWLVHPLQTAAVTYTIQRLESLMGLCFLVTLYCLARGAAANTSWPWNLAAIAFVWLGMGNKEVMAAVLPVALLYDRVFLANSWREVLFRRGWVYAGFLTAIAWLAYWILHLPEDFGSGVGLTEVTPWQHLRTQPGVILYYIGLAFWPAQLTFAHGWPVAIDPMQVYGLGAVILALFGVSCVLLWYRPEIGFLGLSFFLILAPTSSIIPLGDAAFEYRMYLPLAPLVILTLAGVWQFTSFLVQNADARLWARLVPVALVATALLARTWERNRDYQSPAALWQGVVRMYPNYPRALNNLGLALEKQGKVDAARELFFAALHENPDFPEARLNLARAYAREREYGPAIRTYLSYLELKPDDVAAHVGLAQTAGLAGDKALARAQYEMAVRIAPQRKETWRSYGNWRAREGDFREAAQHFRRALELDPEFENVRIALGIAFVELGEDEAALAEFEMVSRRGEHVAVLTKLAWLKATTLHDTLRNGPEALSLALKAVEHTQGTDADALDALAAAYAECGKFEEAEKQEELALRLVNREGAVGQAFAARLAMYRQHIPYRRVPVVRQGAIETPGY